MWEQWDGEQGVGKSPGSQYKIACYIYKGLLQTNSLSFAPFLGK